MTTAPTPLATHPGYDPTRPLAVIDGACALCARSARLIARLDRSGLVQITTTRSPLGAALLRAEGLDPDDPNSWLYVEGGRAYADLAGVLRLARRLGALGMLMRPLALLPRPAQRGLYRLVAENRYRLFGKADLCAAPDANLRARIIA